MNGVDNLDKKTIDILIEKGIIGTEDLEKLKNNNKREYTVKECLYSYYEFLKEEYSDNTILGYKNSTEGFLRFYFNMDKDSSFSESLMLPIFTNSDVKKWFDDLAQRSYEYKSLYKFKHSLSSFFDFLRFKDIPHTVNMDRISIPVNRKRKYVDAMTDSEIRSIAEHADSLRGKLIILLMYETGMKRGELIETKRSYLNLNDCHVKIHYNGVFDRVGYFSKKTARLVKQYVEEWKDEIASINQRRYESSITRGREYKELVMSEYLFQTVKSEKASYSLIFKEVKDASYNYYYKKAKRKGMNDIDAKTYANEESKRVNTDTLRHSRRAWYFSQGLPVDKVRVLMGDENYYTCKKYLKVAQRLYPDKFLNQC